MSQSTCSVVKIIKQEKNHTRPEYDWAIDSLDGSWTGEAGRAGGAGEDVVWVQESGLWGAARGLRGLEGARLSWAAGDQALGEGETGKE